MKRVLIAEDDILIAELERDYLQTAGFEVEVISDGLEVSDRISSGSYDILLLDVMLPGKNGFDVCRELRKRFDMPIIMISARKDSQDTIRGLGVGADDYIIKPFSPSEVVARVKAHLGVYDRLVEQKQKSQMEGIRVGKLIILPNEQKAYAGRQEIALSKKEFELLLFLARNPNVVFSKADLFEKIWGMETVGDTSTVVVHISRLREKLEKALHTFSYIETVWGVGYRFRAA
ncbi:MAG: response regulator transcription factor [Oliverpabstia sp.]